MKILEIGTFPILALIVIMYILQGLVPGFEQSLYFVPSKMFTEPWRVVTSIFLHGSPLHLLLNGWALFLFGTLVEKKAGEEEFFKIFIIAGILGSLGYWLVYSVGIIGDIPALGASGAIYGLIGAAAVLFPDMMLYIWFIPMRMRDAAIAFAVIELFGTMMMTISGIASAAHLGGLIFGFIYMKWRMQGMIEDYYANYYR
jgi:hypothetical protein